MTRDRGVLLPFSWLSVVALAVPLAAQGVVDPPPRDRIAPTGVPPVHDPMPAVDTPWGRVSVSDRIYPVIIPDRGAGLPEPAGEPEAKIRHLPIPHEPFVRSGTNDAPEHFDESAPDAQTRIQDWEGMGPNGWNPPDPDLAAGYEHIVTVTNDDFEVFDQCGNSLFSADANTYLGYDLSYKLYDPKVVFDPWRARWVMMWHKSKASTEESSLVLVVSRSSTPFGVSGLNPYVFDVDMVQNAGTSTANWADYFDLGYSEDFVMASGNMYQFAAGTFDWSRFSVWDKDQLYSGGPLSTLNLFNMVNPDGTQTTHPRAAKMQSGWSEGGDRIDGVFANSRKGGGDKVTLWKLKDPFGANTLVKVDIDVSDYTLPPDAVQPTGETLDPRFCQLMPMVITRDDLNGTGRELYTSLNTDSNAGGEGRVRLFKLDPVAATLEFESTFGASGWHYFFACPAADFSGSAFWVFGRTGPSAGREPEVRYVDYDQGTFSSSSSSIRDGEGSDDGSRWGDYFGGQMDWGDYSENFSVPGRPSKVWLYGEFGKNDSWGTHVAATSVYPQATLTSVTPTTTFRSIGEVGGPFSTTSQTYTLTNTGSLGLAYEVTGLPSWLTVSGGGQGVIGPGDTENVTLTLNAGSLAAGRHTANVTFRDCFNGGASFSRLVRLEVTECFPDLGFGGPGTASATLCGTGLNAGEDADYVVTGATPGAPGALLISLPGFPNVTLFPAANPVTLVSGAGIAAAVPVSAGPGGGFSVTIPGAATVSRIVLQSTFLDPAVLPHNLTATNAVGAQFGL